MPKSKTQVLLDALHCIASQSIASDWSKEQACDFMRKHAREAIAAYNRKPEQPKRGPVVCIDLDDHGLDYGVKVEQFADKRFRVTYGKHVKTQLGYAKAAHEFGECVFHSLACASILDNSGPL